MMPGQTPVREERRVDVLIVGGGLLGCAAAYYLAAAGTSVLLLEKGQLNRQASGQNAGSLHFQLEFRAIEHGEEMARHHALQIPLILDAQERWAGLEDALGEHLEVVQDGGLMVAETPAEIDALRKKFELERSFGLKESLISGDEARAIAPALSQKVTAAIFCPAEGHANPRLVTPALARAAVRLGAEVRTGARVTTLKRTSQGYVATTADGLVITCGAVLNTAGVWINEVAAMLGIQLPIVPVALQMNCTEPTQPVLGHLIQHVGRRLSMKQMQDGHFLIGGGWASRMIVNEGHVDKNASPDVVYESLVGNLGAACAVVPMIRGLQLIRTWTGMTALTVDQVPLLGEVPRFPGFFVAGGGSAFTLGPTYARQLANLVLTGRTEMDIRLYSPGRFAHLTF